MTKHINVTIEHSRLEALEERERRCIELERRLNELERAGAVYREWLETEIANVDMAHCDQSAYYHTVGLQAALDRYDAAQPTSQEAQS